MTIKALCKQQELLGGGGGDRFTSYSFTLLLIFFLQQLGIMLNAHFVQVQIRVYVSGFRIRIRTDPHVFDLPGSGSGQKGKKMNE